MAYARFGRRAGGRWVDEQAVAAQFAHHRLAAGSLINTYAETPPPTGAVITGPGTSTERPASLVDVPGKVEPGPLANPAPVAEAGLEPAIFAI